MHEELALSTFIDEDTYHSNRTGFDHFFIYSGRKERKTDSFIGKDRQICFELCRKFAKKKHKKRKICGKKNEK